AYNLYSLWPDGSHLTPVYDTAAWLDDPRVHFAPMQIDMQGVRVNQILQQMTTFHCVHERPIVAPDDKTLVFRAVQCNPQALEGLYLMRSDGSQFLKLTDSIEPTAVWSPDGQWAVYRDGNRFYRIRADGSDQTLIAENLPVVSPVWSPDAQWIAFYLCDESGCGMPARIKPDGSQLEILSGTLRGQPPLWSPDGQQVIFPAEKGLYLFDFQTTPQLISQEFPRPGSLLWAGDWVYFITGRNARLYRLHPGEAQPHMLTDYSPAVFRMSPDGQWLLFVEKSANRLYRMRPDGSDLQPVFRTERGIYYPLWSPVITLSFHVLPMVVLGVLLIAGFWMTFR
ncbi:MAG: DUF5050 domain-containing protein, partial [Anaerolineae bacterium]|nr:DUF5050 domain-containing protein [Anaerolineae bacterium]